MGVASIRHAMIGQWLSNGRHLAEEEFQSGEEQKLLVWPQDIKKGHIDRMCFLSN